MTHWPTILEAILIANELGVHSWPYSDSRSGKSEKWRDCWAVRICKTLDVYILAKAMRPYAITKQKHWDLILEFIELRLSKTTKDIPESLNLLGTTKPATGSSYTQEEWDIFDKLQAVNKRGPNNQDYRLVDDVKKNEILEKLRSASIDSLTRSLKTKLAQEEVDTVKRLYETTDVTQQHLADILDVNVRTINAIVNNHSWRTEQNNTENINTSDGLGRIALLTWDDVKAIRSLYESGNYTQQALANQFEVSPGTINSVVLGRAWKDPDYIPPPKYAFATIHNIKKKKKLDYEHNTITNTLT